MIIRSPTGVDQVEFSDRQLADGATVRRDKIDQLAGGGFRYVYSDQMAARGPGASSSTELGGRELKLVAAIDAAAPEAAIGVGNITDPLALAREIRAAGRT